MKNKRRAQIADNICFNLKNQDSKQLIHKGKQLLQEIPNIKILKQILQNYYAFLIQPKPFNKFKNFKNKTKFDLHSNLQFLEKLKKSHFDRNVIESMIQSEQNFIPTTKRYKNCLCLNSTYLGQNQLQYIFEDTLRTLVWKYDRQEQKINVEEFKEEQLQFNDKTGVYQLQNYDDLFYVKHLYSIEILKHLKPIQQYSSNSQIFQFQYSEILQKLFILTSNQLRTEDTIIKQFQPNLSEPMITQSIHLNQHPHQLLLQSFKEIQLFDLRKHSSTTLISKDLSELLVNRIYGFDQFQQSQYFLISTNQEFQFYDYRNLRHPFSVHRHGCIENSPSEFIRITDQTINFDDSPIDGYNTINNDSQNESLIAYSNQGHCVVVNFNQGLVEKVKNNLASLRTCQNLLVEKSFQYANDDLATNGLPQLLCTSSIFNRRLRTLGFQFIFLHDKYFVFSLDKQGGLGVQMLDEYFIPIQTSKSCQNIIDEITMIESEKNFQDSNFTNTYNEIFDEFDDISDSDLELVEIDELRPIVKKKKLNGFEVTDFQSDNQNNENNVGFEEGLLLEESAEQDDNEQQVRQSQNFVLTSDIISFLVKQL